MRFSLRCDMGCTLGIGPNLRLEFRSMLYMDLMTDPPGFADNVWSADTSNSNFCTHEGFLLCILVFNKDNIFELHARRTSLFCCSSRPPRSCCVSTQLCFPPCVVRRSPTRRGAAGLASLGLRTDAWHGSRPSFWRGTTPEVASDFVEDDTLGRRRYGCYWCHSTGVQFRV